MLSAYDISYNICNISIIYNVSFCIQKNKCLHIHGMNGSGKTTLLKIISNIITTFNGYILFDNKHVINKTHTSNSINLQSSLLHNLHNIRTMHDTNHMFLKNAIYTLYQFGMEEFINKKLHVLSSGKRKLFMCIPLMLNMNNIWLFDEPTTMLDLNSIYYFKKKIVEHLNSNGICIYTSNENIDLSGLEPLTLRLSSECSTAKL
jgi:ABC-type transport system involved in cytochrome c biogenesis ATPase subunit